MTMANAPLVGTGWASCGLDLWLMKTGIFSFEGLDSFLLICPTG
jgi:hypothetical protein